MKQIFGALCIQRRKIERGGLFWKAVGIKRLNFFDCFLWYLSLQSTVEPVELNVSLKTACVKIIPSSGVLSLKICWPSGTMNLGDCLYGTKLSRPGLRSFWQKYWGAKHPLSSALVQSAKLRLSGVTSPSLKYLSILSALLLRHCEVLVSHRGGRGRAWQCAAELGIREFEHSCVSQVVAKWLQLVWCSGTDLLSSLCSAPLPYTFTPWHGAWVAVPFPGSCDENLPITGTGGRAGMCTAVA